MSIVPFTPSIDLDSFVFRWVGIDSNLSDNFGRSVIYGLSAFTTLLTISVVGGLPFLIGAVVLGSVYWNGDFVRFLL